MASIENQLYIMGIDLGTTSVKICLLNKITHNVEKIVSSETNAEISTDLGNLQDVKKVFKTLEECCMKFSSDQLSRVRSVAVCGQMHGCVFWKQTEIWKNFCSIFEDIEISPLYTWMDDRCHSDFLSSLPVPLSHVRLSTGFGCCTIFWFLRNQPQFLAKFNRCATIQDLLVAYLCRLDEPVMCDQNASSWGYFDPVTGTWNHERLKKEGFPIHLLPSIIKSKTKIGLTKTNWLNLPISCNVYVALGDFQCSVLASMETEQDAILNISTSAQLSFLKQKGFLPDIPIPENQIIDYFPYFDDQYLAVAASLNGGNVLVAFVKMLHQWIKYLGAEISEKDIWKKLTTNNTDITSDIVIDPTIFGERYQPGKRASVLNLDSCSHQLNEIYFSICKGLVSNLQSFISSQVLQQNGIQRIIGNGNAFLKNLILQEEVRKQYNLPVVLCNEKDAAVGAALSVLKEH